MLTNAELVLLGTVLGSVLTWLTGWSTSRTQWRREQRRNAAERRAGLYEATLIYLGQIHRAQIRQELHERQGSASAELPDEQADAERSTWSARMQLHASPEVKDLWEEWTYAVGSNAIVAHEAQVALVERMRAEVDPS